jgi:hypothetical protein
MCFSIKYLHDIIDLAHRECGEIGRLDIQQKLRLFGSSLADTHHHLYPSPLTYITEEIA